MAKFAVIYLKICTIYHTKLHLAWRPWYAQKFPKGEGNPLPLDPSFRAAVRKKFSTPLPAEKSFLCLYRAYIHLNCPGEIPPLFVYLSNGTYVVVFQIWMQNLKSNKLMWQVVMTLETVLKVISSSVHGQSQKCNIWARLFTNKYSEKTGGVFVCPQDKMSITINFNLIYQLCDAFFEHDAMNHFLFWSQIMKDRPWSSWASLPLSISLALTLISKQILKWLGKNLCLYVPKRNKVYRPKGPSEYNTLLLVTRLTAMSKMGSSG